MALERAISKTVVITGGATGIGFETARYLLSLGGYRLILLGKTKDHLEGAAKELGGLSEQLSVYPCDLNNIDEVQKTASRILGSTKDLYGLVNNAGIYPFGELSTTTIESWDETMNINLKAPFLLCQALAPGLAKHPKGARIVNVSSTAGILPNHFALAYSVSKAALIQMTRTLAKELGKNGITVNCLCPGIVRSPLHEGYHSNRSQLEEFYARRGAAYPLGRVGETRDIASAIRFFLSEEASWITGDVMVIDGGRLLT